MKNLDFGLQKFGLVSISAMLTIAVFEVEFFIVPLICLFFLGLYQVVHFIVYLPYTYANGHKLEHGFWIYPLFVITFFLFWKVVFFALEERIAWPLFTFHALGIGGYYTYLVHHKI